jgi:hypothetical protein
MQLSLLNRKARESRTGVQPGALYMKHARKLPAFCGEFIVICGGLAVHAYEFDR